MTQATTNPDKFLRTRDVLDRMGVSRSYWFCGLKQGKFPPGTLLSARVRVWRQSEIDSLIATGKREG